MQAHLKKQVKNFNAKLQLSWNLLENEHFHKLAKKKINTLGIK